MKIYLQQNVFDAALDRFRWLFDEFRDPVVNFSGGKDSTVCLQLALRVQFIDQEAEWQMVIDYMRTVAADPRVRMQWLQIPFKIFNATSVTDPWLQCWEPGKTWMRDKEPDSVHTNVYGTDRFAELFNKVQDYDYPHEPNCYIGGVRTAESPARFKGLTSYETYNGATWGRVNNKRLGHYTMYPLYDWGDTDVWKAIHDHRWTYCRVYDFQFMHGVQMRNMRVSNLHHETAVQVLYYLQEVEADTWNRLTARLAGINTAGHLRADMFAPKDLPFMFASWREYRDYLLEHLVDDPKIKAIFRRQFASNERMYRNPKVLDDLCRLQISAVLVNDHFGTKLASFHASHGMYSINAGSKGGRTHAGLELVNK